MKFLCLIFLSFQAFAGITLPTRVDEDACVRTDPPSFKKRNLDVKFTYNDETMKMCDETNLPYQIRSALALLGRLEDDTEGVHPKFNEGFDIGGPLSYFAKRVHHLSFDKSCTFGEAAHYDPVSKFVLVCEGIKMSTFEIAQILDHEARHGDDDYYDHQKCDSGPWKHIPMYACDPSVEWGGAYAVSLQVMDLMRRDPKMSSSIRREARAKMIEYSIEHFQKPLFDLMEGVVAQDVAGGVWFDANGVLDPIFEHLDPRYELMNNNNQIYLHFKDVGTATYDWNREEPYFDTIQSSKKKDPSTSVRNLFAGCHIWADLVQCVDNFTHVQNTVWDKEGRGFREPTLYNTSWIRPGQPNITDIYVGYQDQSFHYLKVNSLNVKDKHFIDYNAEDKDVTRVMLTFPDVVEIPESRRNDIDAKGWDLMAVWHSKSDQVLYIKKGTLLRATDHPETFKWKIDIHTPDAFLSSPKIKHLSSPFWWAPELEDI